MSLEAFLIVAQQSALSESEGMDWESEGVESYKIPVTIGVSGMMVTNQSKTSKVMLSHPNGKEITVVKISSQEQGKNQRYNVASLSSEDLGKPFYVYYPSEYIQNREMNRERFRTEIEIPALKEGVIVEKIRLHALTLFSKELRKWVGEGYAEVITSNAQ